MPGARGLSVATEERRARRCAWCGESFGGGAEQLAGRIRCDSCGAATTSPRPTDAELAAAYGDWYRPGDGQRFSFAGDAILSRTRAALAQRIDAIAPAGPILDVGAGDGTLIDALRARGREAVGLERNSARPDFRDEPIAEIEGEWAAVVFWHSLEHLPDPGDAIEHAARLLAPGGVVAVAVPNNESLQAEVFGDRWLHLDIPRHLSHLTASALRNGLQRQGLRIERVSFVRGGQIVIGWLDGLVGMTPGHPSLYQALRVSRAQIAPQSVVKRARAIALAILLLPFAVLGGATEILMRRAGTVYIEARRG